MAKSAEEHAWQGAFASTGPDQWLWQSTILSKSAEHLRSAIEEREVAYQKSLETGAAPGVAQYEYLGLKRVYLMLQGMAAEALLKGAIFRQHLTVQEQKAISEGELPQGRLRNHWLVKLAKDVLGTVDREDEELLTTLETHLVWAGRYPMPIDSRAFWAEPGYKKASQPIPQAVPGWLTSPRVVEEAEDLLKRLRDQLFGNPAASRP